jgi:hypothetical protein
MTTSQWGCTAGGLVMVWAHGREDIIWHARAMSQSLHYTCLSHVLEAGAGMLTSTSTRESKSAELYAFMA